MGGGEERDIANPSLLLSKINVMLQDAARMTRGKLKMCPLALQSERHRQRERVVKPTRGVSGEDGASKSSSKSVEGETEVEEEGCKCKTERERERGEGGRRGQCRRRERERCALQKRCLQDPFRLLLIPSPPPPPHLPSAVKTR